VNVAANGQPPTIPELREVLADSSEIDRTQINSWEDVDFRRAVEATGRAEVDHDCVVNRPISWVSLACELQRDWARTDTVPEVVDIVLTSRLLKGL
jgi:hypothetical protein